MYYNILNDNIISQMIHRYHTGIDNSYNVINGSHNIIGYYNNF